MVNSETELVRLGDRESQSVRELLWSDLLASSDQVLTWWEIADNYRYYSQWAIRSGVRYINNWLKIRGDQRQVRIFGSKSNSFGIGIVGGDNGDPSVIDLGARLKRRLTLQAIGEVDAFPDKYVGFQVDGVGLQFPQKDTGVYLSPRVVLVEREDGEKEAIFPTSQDQYKVLEILANYGGYIDQALYFSLTGEVNNLVKAVLKINGLMKNGHVKKTRWIKQLNPMFPGYAVNREGWRRNRLIRRLVQEDSDRGAEIPEIVMAKTLRMNNETGVVVWLAEAEKFLGGGRHSYQLVPAGTRPYLLVSFPVGDRVGGRRTLVVELGEVEAKTIEMFGESVELGLGERTRGEVDNMRHALGRVVKKSSELGYVLSQGAGYTEGKLVFPVVE